MVAINLRNVLTPSGETDSQNAILRTLNAGNGELDHEHKVALEAGQKRNARMQVLEVGKQGRFSCRGICHGLHGVKSSAHMPHLAGMDAS